MRTQNHCHCIQAQKSSSPPPKKSKTYYPLNRLLLDFRNYQYAPFRYTFLFLSLFIIAFTDCKKKKCDDTDVIRDYNGETARFITTATGKGKGPCTNNVKNGQWTFTYTITGKDTTYTAIGTGQFENGKKVGQWVYINDNDTSTQTYKDGKLTKDSINKQKRP